MLFTNRSKRLLDIQIPTEVLYSTLLVDSLESYLPILDYDKVLLITDTYQNQDLSGFAWKFCIGSQDLFLSLYEKPTLSCNVSFVIQGPLHINTPYTILYTAPYGAICLGIWDSDFSFVQTQVLQYNIDNYYNKYFQITSTLKGLFQVKTEYAIKVRADEYYINFIPFLSKLKSLPPHQILTSNIYFRKANCWPYHISDHIMGSKTQTLLSMFTLSYNHAKDRTLLKITPEVHFAISYLSQFYPVHPEDRDIQKIITCMYTFFSLFQIYEFENYKVKTIEKFLTKEDGKVQDINTLEAMSDFHVSIPST